jgi:multidrug efflux pump subunit AcrA (membrane-fusion protein)
MSKDELDVREAESEAADAGVGQAEADLASAKVSLEYTTLRAPRNGVILAKLKEVGEIAVPGGFSGSGDLIRMANLEDLRGQVDITESELAKVRMEQRAEVVPDAYPDRKYAARVVKLYPQVDRQKGTLRVEVQIEKPDDFLWPDMSARHHVPGRHRSAVRNGRDPRPADRDPQRRRRQLRLGAPGRARAPHGGHGRARLRRAGAGHERTVRRRDGGGGIAAPARRGTCGRDEVVGAR